MVSIIMATFNRAHLIEESLGSIANQTYEDWECLIIDDGSNDNTEELIHKWSQKDSRFKYKKRTSAHQKGLPGCRNQGLKIAQGDYVIFFDDDDIIHPQNLELCLKYFEFNDLDFVHYNKQPFFGTSDVFFEVYETITTIFKIDQNKIYDSITNKLGIASCTVMWKKSVFDKYKFNENLQYAEEWDLYNRLIIYGFTGHKITNVLYFNRKHDASNTGNFYKQNPTQIKSKIKAIVSIINCLDMYSMLDRNYIKYFVDLGNKLNTELIHTTLFQTSSIDLSKRLYIKFRVFYASMRHFLRSFKPQKR